MSYNALERFTKVTLGPPEVEMALHAIGRQRLVDFRLGNETSDIDVLWLRNCQATAIRPFHDEKRPHCHIGLRADMEMTFATDEDDDLLSSRILEVRILYNVFQQKGDVLEIKLRDGRSVIPQFPKSRAA